MVLISNVLGFSLIYSFLLFCSLTDHLHGVRRIPIRSTISLVNTSHYLHFKLPFLLAYKKAIGFPILRFASDPQRSLSLGASSLIVRQIGGAIEEAPQCADPLRRH